MRTFCLLLVLVNALYFIWVRVIDVQVGVLDRTPPAVAEPPPRIVLAREAQSPSTPELPVAPAPANEPADEPTRVAVAAPPATHPAEPVPTTLTATACTSVGPFADLAQAAQAQATLRSIGHQSRQRVEEGELWAGHWVTVRGFENRAQAEAALKTITGRGITDVYVMPGDDPANALSLGVFSDYQRAQRRAEEVRAIGMTPQISDRTRAGAAFWLDVDLPPQQTIDTSVFQVGQSRILRLELRSCPE